jgi:hypothetical protein
VGDGERLRREARGYIEGKERKESGFFFLEWIWFW